MWRWRYAHRGENPPILYILNTLYTQRNLLLQRLTNFVAMLLNCSLFIYGECALNLLRK